MLPILHVNMRTVLSQNLTLHASMQTGRQAQRMGRLLAGQGTSQLGLLTEARMRLESLPKNALPMSRTSSLATNDFRAPVASPAAKARACSLIASWQGEKRATKLAEK